MIDALLFLDASQFIDMLLCIFCRSVYQLFISGYFLPDYSKVF